VSAPRLIRTAQAEADLIEIWLYIAQDNPRAADRLLDTLDEKSWALASSPGLGVRRAEIAPDVRSFPAAAT
jgi:toxin ParE1/3/4